MAATVEISVPDTLVTALGAQPANLPQQTLEALIIHAYRNGKITHAQVGELLDLDRWETDAFLKQAQAFRAGENEEFATDLERLRRQLDRIAIQAQFAWRGAQLERPEPQNRLVTHPKLISISVPINGWRLRRPL